MDIKNASISGKVSSLGSREDSNRPWLWRTVYNSPSAFNKNIGGIPSRIIKKVFWSVLFLEKARINGCRTNYRRSGRITRVPSRKRKKKYIYSRKNASSICNRWPEGKRGAMQGRWTWLPGNNDGTPTREYQDDLVTLVLYPSYRSKTWGRLLLKTTVAGCKDTTAYRRKNKLVVRVELF